ncbi:MAG: undecaprenyl-phosphate glucose phosphotransferase [Pseudomonadota bacterium]
MQPNVFYTAKLNPAKVMSDSRHDWLIGHSTLTTFVYAVVDALAVIVSALLAGYFINASFNVPLETRAAILVAVLVTWIVFNAAGMYVSWRGRSYVDQVRALTISWISVALLLAVIAYLVWPGILSDRSWVITWASLGMLLIVSVRLAAMATLRAYRQQGHNHKRIVIVGGGNWGQHVISRISAAEWLGLDIVGVIDDNPEHIMPIDGVVHRGGLENLIDVIAEHDVSEVWICLPLGSRRTAGSDKIGEVMRMLNDSTVTQRLLPEIEEMRILDRPVTEIVGLPVVNLNTSPIQGASRFGKAILDRLLSALILLVISPILIAIAVAIKLDSRGPIFFMQQRHGSNGKPFMMFKFRTMRQHAERPGEVTQACRDDNRVTRIGNFLRRNSLDELPQFLNVILGDMSIVGPRPHAIEHNEFYRTQIDSYMQRHRVKPGITGWAQINGFRGATEDIEKMRQRVNHDLYYIERWSFWMDVKIILRTVVHGFRHDNAY